MSREPGLYPGRRLNSRACRFLRRSGAPGARTCGRSTFDARCGLTKYLLWIWRSSYGFGCAERGILTTGASRDCTFLRRAFGAGYCVFFVICTNMCERY